MPTRRMLFLSGALTAIVATVLPLKVVAGADGLLGVALSSVAAQEGNGNGGGAGESNGGNGNGGSGGNSNGSDNAGGSGNDGNGSGNGNSGNGNGGGTDTGSGGGTGGSGTGTGAGSAPGGGAANPGGAAPAQPATPATPSKAGVEVDVRGTSITVRHHNGTTERISQGRYEMRDSRSRTIVNRTATPSDTSRLRSFGR
ncbi:hypothetical protein [Neorhizobium sp. LjRoot104]|uniref:hypothetical protein n=1 Tax=Neorhizobium sp. LjRoot104 TaxID=3342254 RepID=UPI003ECC4FE1